MARPRIGYLTNEVMGNYQWPLFNALVAQAKLIGVDFIAYEGRSINTSLFRDSQYNLIFDFVDEQLLDGLIISSGSVFCYINPDEIAQWLDKRFQLPLVSINLPISGASNILLRNEAGFEALLEHVLNVHQCQHLVLVTGPPTNQESLARENIFRQTIDANSAVEANYIEGDFTAQTGTVAMRQILEMVASGSRIDAVIFANDDMAVAGLEYLTNHHPRQAHHFVITGFDDSPCARLIAPSLTTVRQPFEAMAKQAISSVLEQITNEAPSRDHWFDTEPVFRASCGCQVPSDETSGPMLRFASNPYKMHEMTQTYKVNELLAQLATGLPYFDIRGCYVALYEGGRFQHSEQGHNRIPAKSRLIFAYHQNQHCPLKQPIIFTTRQVLPESFIGGEQPVPLLVKPLMFDNQHFGFIVFDVSDGGLSDMDDVRQQVAQTLNAALLFEEKSQAVEAAELANKKLRDLNKELASLNELLTKRSVTDELTGLYNRRGFFDLVHQYAVTDRVLNRCTLFYVDMNELKLVNDKLGHHQGDVAIQLLAEALRLTFRQEDIIGRIGGDEFVVCAKRCGPDDIDTLVGRFNQVLAQCNQASTLPWDVSSCMGYQSFCGGSEQELEQALERADHMLYQHKAEYKRRKAKHIKEQRLRMEQDGDRSS